jgi:hypothetical protein
MKFLIISSQIRYISCSRWRYYIGAYPNTHSPGSSQFWNVTVATPAANEDGWLYSFKCIFKCGLRSNHENRSAVFVHITWYTHAVFINKIKLLMNFFFFQNITTEFILHNIVGSDGQYCVSSCIAKCWCIVLNFRKSVHYYIVVIGIILKQTTILAKSS